MTSASSARSSSRPWTDSRSSATSCTRATRRGSSSPTFAASTLLASTRCRVASPSSPRSGSAIARTSRTVQAAPRAAAPHRRKVRIVSLLPSATETLFALGLGDQIVAVTHECDYPPEAAALPVVTRSTLDLGGRTSADIDVAVALAAREGRSLYEVDTDAILRLDPDLAVAQDICDVCAIPQTRSRPTSPAFA